MIERLLGDDAFQTDERLIVFTEYKTTLDYLARRLRSRYGTRRVLTLFGTGSLGGTGMSHTDRENVKSAFNDPQADVRVLVATDAASEGLNLHRTARYLLHYDCPWNPSRLEQRNGRLDRYGQAHDVTVHHFVSDTDPDMRFLDHVIRKADEIREDLGSVNEVFGRAVHRRLIQGEDADTVQADLVLGLDSARQRASTALGLPAILHEEPADQAAPLNAMAAEIDLDPGALGKRWKPRWRFREAGRSSEPRDPASIALQGRISRVGRMSSTNLYAKRRPTARKDRFRNLLSGAEPFIRQLGPMSVFLPRSDALLMHLGPPHDATGA